MSKLKKIVLFSGMGAIALAIVISTLASFISYQVYRNSKKEQQAQVVVMEEL